MESITFVDSVVVDSENMVEDGIKILERQKNIDLEKLKIQKYREFLEAEFDRRGFQVGDEVECWNNIKDPDAMFGPDPQSLLLLGGRYIVTKLSRPWIGVKLASDPDVEKSVDCFAIRFRQVG